MHLTSPQSAGLALGIRLGLAVLSLTILVFSVAWYSDSQADPILSVDGTASYAYPGDQTAYTIELLNHTDQILYDGVISITLPAGFTYVSGTTLVMGEGWPMDSHEPAITGQTLSWGPYHLPAASVDAHNPYGIHTLMDCGQGIPTLHLEGAKMLAGSGGYVTQLFYPITSATSGPSQCAVNFVQEAYARNLIPIIRLGGYSVNGIWQAPDPGLKGDYAEIAQAFARFVAGLPRREANPLYVQIWNEPDLWIEWSNKPNAGQYARFFVAVSAAIRRLGDARIRVVNGALTPGNITFLKQLLQVPGFKDAFDVWASHCYPYNHPPSYNNHNGSARYGTYTIDCYLRELNLLKNHGRPGIKVLITETGYKLGDATYGFEGFPRINESNRASYISDAFARYWQKWPEVIAVTPFELTDPYGQWRKFDWIEPGPPYTPHAQFKAVSALPKPVGKVTPRGYQIHFQVKVAADLLPGVYPSQLSGSDSDGHTAFAAEAVPVRVFKAGTLNFVYLPILTSSPGRDGPWYMGEVDSSPGAIVPTALLQAPLEDRAALALTSGMATTLALSGEPQTIALDETAGVGLVTLTGGRLEIVDLSHNRIIQTITLNTPLQRAVPGDSRRSHVYVSLADGLALINWQQGQVVARLTGVGRIRGIAWDATTRRLFAVDAEHDRLLVLADDLSELITVLALDDQPDQIILDSAARHLYLSFPARPGVAAVDADTLAVTAQSRLVGGPILGLAFDERNQRLYALSLLAPRHQGLTVWRTPMLDRRDLVAGAGDFSLRMASTIAVRPDGDVLISEATEIWQIAPDNFMVRRVYQTGMNGPAADLVISQKGDAAYLLEPLENSLRVYKW